MRSIAVSIDSSGATEISSRVMMSETCTTPPFTSNLVDMTAAQTLNFVNDSAGAIASKFSINTDRDHLMRHILTCVGILIVCTAAPARAQDYPQKPVRAITALSAGGTSDVFMRVLGDQFQKRTGQPIVVENRPGGALNIGGQACADAAPDGYTICLLPVETLA